ncbi:hypothetical protein [Paenibacillus radicis (ex Gao et al. 2016)]|uniref:Endolytic transglycosylase MltG n=1 Tax=Paenibacillus radicis (ex Gao et al. 2016) TaxID=1737354 RepID=A0A917HJF1_9BACL|nr:hypothetical protein [Paenibacillus radicis (ex Gao et al. 2016)]GGG80567.1 hypothetical protein GCM10010918_42170 [Paenibacillus radicis (ex Gao et al. 2016)]
MLKNRMFLTGLGMGIIVGALLLQLLQIGEQSQAKLGESLFSGDEKQYSQQELDAAVAAARQEKTPDKPAISPAGTEATAVPSATPVTTTQPEKEPPSTEKPKQNEEPEAPVQELILQIKGGMNLTGTAKLLADNGLIEDEAAFIAAMKRSKKPTVRAGYFLFKGKPQLQEIISIIKSDPLTKEERAELKARGIE